jgi:hypothetical protein
MLCGACMILSLQIVDVRWRGLTARLDVVKREREYRAGRCVSMAVVVGAELIL